ncbi:hypothetical protein [Flavobacterium oreochromis]|uniref:Lipoprotein n=3 Tax=Flavobacterium oreochromis TaxID=2906078 RepID=A0ABW8P8E3_9FLAO
MVNKLAVVLIFFVFGCQKKSDCDSENVNEIYFQNTNHIPIDYISFSDLNGVTSEVKYSNPKLKKAEKNIEKLEINEITSQLVKDGFLITINGKYKYRIEDVKYEEIFLEKRTMWGTKLYGCYLKEYKLNGDLINYGNILIKL